MKQHRKTGDKTQLKIKFYYLMKKIHFQLNVTIFLPAGTFHT